MKLTLVLLNLLTDNLCFNHLSYLTLVAVLHLSSFSTLLKSTPADMSLVIRNKSIKNVEEN